MAVSTTKSKVPELVYSQTAYINDGAVATTSSDKEKTKLVFAQDEAQEDLGFYLTLITEANSANINNQTAHDVEIICNGQQVGRLTVTKTTA